VDEYTYQVITGKRVLHDDLMALSSKEIFFPDAKNGSIH
jgi:hypothetical protein